MAQLSNDCFQTGDAPLSLADAVHLIRERVQPVALEESVLLAEADNRVLAADIVAGLALPPFDNAAVDGYAVRSGDLAPGRETVLPLIGRIAAGENAGGFGEGGAVRIFTGAPMPPGFDTVFMQEDVVLAGGTSNAVTLPPGLAPGANRRLAGEDIAAGQIALLAGRRLTPPDLALLGALGHAAIPIRRPLRVAIMSTGNEVAEPGGPLAPGGLYDANRPMLAGLLRRLGLIVGDLGILPDRREAVQAALQAAARDYDLVVTSGGVSTGEEDHVKAGVAASGSLAFWRVGIKPGRPVALGLVGRTPFIGLPGNPVAVFVTFAFVARPLIAALQGEAYTVPEPVPVRAGFAYKKKEGRREFVRATLGRTPEGVPLALKHPREGAGIITSLTEASGFVCLPEHVTRVTEGDSVDYLAFSALR
jgi:molybdopterin molybdotransferase